MQELNVSAYRKFHCSDEWFETISPHFVGVRVADRRGRFSLTAHLESIAGSCLFDVSMHRSGFQPGQRGFSVEGVARHRFFGLWQVRGTSSIEQAGKVINLRAGHWAMFEASSPCSFNVDDGSRSIGVMVSEREDHRWGELIGQGGCALPRSEDGDMAAAMISESLGRSAPLDHRIQQTLELLLIDLLDVALERSAATRSSDTQPRTIPIKLRRAKELIATELGNAALRSEDIARAVGVSRRALYHLFGQIGETPMSYVRSQRLKEAAHRLRSAKLEGRTINQIAYDLGFADPSHFSRLFRAQYGISPRLWGNTAHGD